MFIGLKTKILLTVLAIVLLFTVFSLLYFPSQQGRTLLSNYSSEVQNQAKTIALGASIALSEQNFKGIQTAMDFVKENEELKFVALIQKDSIWNEAHTSYLVKDTVVVAYPDDQSFRKNLQSNDSLIVKRAPFKTNIMEGEIMLVVRTDSIRSRQKKIWLTALLVSGAIFIIGMLIGLWLSRNISHPVLALRKAAKRVGDGDLSPVAASRSKDEIGELSVAFNNMVSDIKKLSELTLAQEKEKQVLLATQNEALEKQVEERTLELRQSLEKLKTTQTQLVQAEKMASLGELTAGIAHEIQNPLNFVNNFSEVSNELIQEMMEEVQRGNYDTAKEIAEDIKQNLEKINHHGKRADSIVKGMLLHSRTSSGQKELTDINNLVDECLRLSFHGMRAKDKSFNAKTETVFDDSLAKVNVVSQDIGRVILNLFTNSFYSVMHKRKLAGEGYSPVVSASTGKEGNMVKIIVRDNGIGIPQKVIDKIFQPFFTTKPAGEGTGLGLSMSYEIITKGHNGELRVDSKEGEFAEFTIILPV